MRTQIGCDVEHGEDTSQHYAKKKVSILINYISLVNYFKSYECLLDNCHNIQFYFNTTWFYPHERLNVISILVGLIHLFDCWLYIGTGPILKILGTRLEERFREYASGILTLCLCQSIPLSMIFLFVHFSHMDLIENVGLAERER